MIRCSNPDCILTATAVACTNCKIKYCSSKCKKANKKHTCTFVPSEPKVVQKVVSDIIPVKTERRQYMMHLEHRLQEIIYPDGTDGAISIIEEGGTVIPCMTDARATYLFGTLYERCKGEVCVGDVTKGYLQAKFTDYVELAAAFADGDVSSFEWIDDADGEPSVIRTLEKNGRGNCLLFGRLIIGKHLRTCTKLTLC